MNEITKERSGWDEREAGLDWVDIILTARDPIAPQPVLPEAPVETEPYNPDYEDFDREEAGCVTGTTNGHKWRSRGAVITVRF